MNQRATGCALVAVMLCTACGATPSHEADTSAGESTDTGAELIYGLLHQRSSFISYASPPRNIIEALPGSAFGQGEGKALSSLMLVAGTVSAVEEGQAYALEGATDTPVSSDSPDIDTLTLVVTLDVTESTCATVAVPDTVQFGFFVSSSDQTDAARDAFREMGEIAIFLTSGADPKGKVLSQSMLELLTTVDGEGNAPWPVARDTFGQEWLVGGTTLAELRKACPA